MTEKNESPALLAGQDGGAGGAGSSTENYTTTRDPAQCPVVKTVAGLLGLAHRRAVERGGRQQGRPGSPVLAGLAAG